MASSNVFFPTLQHVVLFQWKRLPKPTSRSTEVKSITHLDRGDLNVCWYNGTINSGAREANNEGDCKGEPIS